MQLTSLWHGKVFRCCPNNTKRKDLKTKTPVIRNRLTLKFSIMTKLLSILLLSLPFLTSGVNSCNSAEDLSDARIIIQGKDGKEFVNLDLMTVAKAIPENLNILSSPLTNGHAADSLKAVYLLKKNGFTDEEIALLNQEKCPEYTEYINRVSRMADNMTIDDLMNLDVEKVAYSTGAVEPITAIIGMIREKTEQIAKDIVIPAPPK